MNLVEKIKEKWELRNVDESLILRNISEYFKENPKEKDKVEERDKKSVKKIIKSVRNSLRNAYGVFLAKDYTKIDSFLDRLKKDKSIESHKKLLWLHSSTRERFYFYPDFYEWIFSITGKPGTIMDIACGLNPMSYVFMDISSVKYYAYDLNEKDAEILNRYFRIMGIEGKARKLDLNSDRLPAIKSDVCFALKIFDILDNKTVESIVNGIRCNFLVASFPTKTISLRKMNYTKRGGFERMLKRLGLSFHKNEFENELVYVIKK